MERMIQEVALLKKYYPEISTNDTNTWFLLAKFPIPPNRGWDRDFCSVAFTIPPGYPNASPYGIYVPSDIKINNNPPNNFAQSQNPPFEGSWGILSWTFEAWQPSPEISSGTNLLNFVNSFKQRFLEGS